MKVWGVGYFCKNCVTRAAFRKQCNNKVGGKVIKGINGKVDYTSHIKMNVELNLISKYTI